MTVSFAQPEYIHGLAVGGTELELEAENWTVMEVLDDGLLMGLLTELELELS